VVGSKGWLMRRQRCFVIPLQEECSAFFTMGVACHSKIGGGKNSGF